MKYSPELLRGVNVSVPWTNDGSWFKDGRIYRSICDYPQIFRIWCSTLVVVGL